MSTSFRFKNADNTTVDFEDYYVRADYFRSGNLWGWGINDVGQLGDNTIIYKSSPVQTVAFGTNWKQVSVGSSHTAAIKTDGSLWCFGRNNFGKLGDNATTNRSSPVQTTTYGTNWKQTSCGQSHTAAIKTDGTLWSWGQNYLYGQVGDNTTINRSSPVQDITLGKNWSQVSCCSNYSLAIKTDGTLWGWGQNSNGQLGDNTTGSKSSPSQTITLGTNWKQVYAGAYHCAAVKTDGTLWCWGNNLQYGALGDNTIILRSSPVQTVAFGTNWKQVACGYNNTAAVKQDGTLWCWGYNVYGQLGDGTITHRSSPVQTVAYGKNWKQVSCGDRTTVAIKTDGTLWCWGYNYQGQLGNNTVGSTLSPVQTIMYGTNWKQVSCGGSNTAAIQYQDDYQ
jgi:alpha-tubulin suppressor-like RCC1 family protein